MAMIRVGLVIILFCADKSSAVPSLQQMEPQGDVDVCFGGVLQYRCIAENGLEWRASDSPNMPVQYSTSLSIVNDSGPAGVFITKLVDISGITLTSTATIENVSLEDNGKNISCRDSGNTVTKMVQIEGPPSSPNNLTATVKNSAGNTKAVTVNLTWSEINSNCMVQLYHVEVNSVLSSNSTNTTSQYLELLLNIGEEYSFRVRGVDTANRLGDWSSFFVFTPMIISSTLLPISTPTTTIVTVVTSTRIPITDSSKGASMTSTIALPTMTMTPMSGLSGGQIAGIVVGAVIAVVIVLGVVIGIITAITCICRKGNYDVNHEPEAQPQRED